MRHQLQAVLATSVFLLPAFAFAQTSPGDITFEVPLNLTRLAPDITQIDITCNIQSDAIAETRVIRGVTNQGKLAGHVVLNVSQGRLVTTANVVVPVPAGSLQETRGKSASYKCMITGYSAGIRAPRGSLGSPAGWDFFDASHANPSFQLTPTPAPITGSFDW